MPGNQKEALEQDLREDLKEAEEFVISRPDTFCAKVLKAIERFLTSWGVLVGGNDDESDEFIPCSFLLNTICRVHRLLGPGNDDLRECVLSMLRSVETRKCRAVVLTFLPATLARDNHNKTVGRRLMKPSVTKAKKEVLSSLHQIFKYDTSLMGLILTTLSAMEDSNLLQRKDVFQFALQTLPMAPENNLHIVIQALIQSSDHGNDAQDAVDSVRTELSLLEKTDVSDMFAVVAVFDAAIESHENLMFVEQYIIRLEEIPDETSDKIIKAGQGGKEVDPDSQLSVFDLAMILLARGRGRFRERIQTFVLDSISRQPGIFLTPCPQKLVELVQERDSQFNFRLRERLMDSYMDFSLVVLLKSLNSKTRFGLKNTRFKFQDFMVKIVMALPQDFQKKILVRMLRMFQEIIKQLQKDGKFLEDGKASFHDKQDKRLLLSICHEILSIFVAVACAKPEILIPCRSQFVKFVESDGIHSPYQDSSLVTNLCKLTSMLTRSDLTGNDLLALCRTLLFSKGAVTDSSTANQSTIQRQVRGFVFANEIAKRDDLDSKSSNLLRRFALRLLGKSSSGTVDPRVGVEGIRLLRQLFQTKRLSSFDERDAIGRILSNTRIVHYPKNPRDASESGGVLVRYSNVPKFLMSKSDKIKTANFREMICCFESYFDTKLVKPSMWTMLSIWVYTLLDTFFVVGRPLKWIPRAWTEAGIEFPAVPLFLWRGNDKGRRLVAWFQNDFGRYQCPSTESSNASHLEKIFLDTMNSLKRSSERKELIEYSHKFTLSLLLGLSLSAAVLKNICDYFKNALGGDHYEVKSEAIKFIQHQLVKIHDLKQNCQSMRNFFRVVSRRKWKRGKSNNSVGSVIEEACIAVDQLTGILRDFPSSTSFVPEEAVWIALTDASHDSFIISYLKNDLEIDGLSEDDLSEVLQMRLDLLYNLSRFNNYKLSLDPCGEASAMEISQRSILRQRVAQCLRLALFISRRLPHLKDARCSDIIIDKLADISAKYLRLLRTILISITGLDDMGETSPSDDDELFFFCLYKSLLGSQSPINDAIQTKAKGENFRMLIISCYEHLQCCSASVATELLDTLSVFAILATRSDTQALHCMVDFSWEAMKFKFDYEETGKIAAMPFALKAALEQLAPSIFDEAAEPSFVDFCLKETLVKLTPIEPLKTDETHSHLTHSMCRHWGLIALTPRNCALCIEHLTRFFVELRDYLDDNDKPLEISIPVKCTISSALKRNDASPSQNGGGDQLQSPSSNQSCPRRKEIPPSQSFPWLSFDRCLPYFDILFKMTVASIGIFSISDEVATSRSTSWSPHPFSLLENHFELCGSLIKLFEDCSSSGPFPESFPITVLQTLKLLMEASVEKLHQCIDWRNMELQPSVAIADGAYDPAAKGFLKDLVDTFDVEVIGRTERLCCDKDSDQKLVSLRRKVQKASVSIRQITVEYELGELKTSFSEDSDRDTEPKAKRRKTKEGYSLSFDGSTIEESDRLSGENQEGKATGSSFGRLSEVGKNTSEKSEDEASMTDFSDSSSSGAFGVSGDWGQGNDLDDDGDDDSSRQLGEITVTH